MKTKRRKHLAHIANRGEYQTAKASKAVARMQFLIACTEVEPAICEGFGRIRDAWPHSRDGRSRVALSFSELREFNSRTGILDDDERPNVDHEAELRAAGFRLEEPQEQLRDIAWADLLKCPDHPPYAALIREVSAWQSRWSLTAPWCADWALEAARLGPPFQIPEDDGYESVTIAPPPFNATGESWVEYKRRLSAWVKKMGRRKARDRAAKERGLTRIPDKREVDHFYWLAEHQVCGTPAALIAEVIDFEGENRRTVQMALTETRKLLVLPERMGPEGRPLRGKARDDKVRDLAAKFKKRSDSRKLRWSIAADVSKKKGPVFNFSENADSWSPH